MESFKIIHSYQDQASLRRSFNALATEIFGISFENWYQNGFWTDQYNPYSVCVKDKIVANVSVSRMRFQTKHGERNFLQLGTVMTDPAYRKQGLIRRLIERIEADYKGKTDGYFLFANDSVLDFYPKFGYRSAAMYGASKAVHIKNTATAEKFPMKEKSDWDAFGKIIRASTVQSALDMRGNAELPLFYLSGWMQDAVYFIRGIDAFAVAEIEGSTLLLSAVFSEKQVDLNRVIEAFGNEITEVRLGFTPLDLGGWQMSPAEEADTTLFVKGEGFKDWEAERLIFPPLTHA